MSVQDVKYTWQGETASGAGASRRIVRVATILAESSDNVALVEASTSVPQPGSRHPSSLVHRLEDRTITRIAPTLYSGVFTYATDATVEESPLDQPWQISVDTQESDEECDYDANGDPYLNTVGDPVVPPPRRPFYDISLVITRNEDAFSIDRVIAYKNTVNDSSFWGGPAGMVLLKNIQVANIPGDPEYFSVTYTFLFRIQRPPDVSVEESWHSRRLNKGTRYLDPDALDLGPLQMFDANGAMVTTEFLLRENGSLLNDDGTGPTPLLPEHDEQPVWLTSPRFKAASWADLAINWQDYYNHNIEGRR